MKGNYSNQVQHSQYSRFYSSQNKQARLSTQKCYFSFFFSSFLLLRYLFILPSLFRIFLHLFKRAFCRLLDLEHNKYTVFHIGFFSRICFTDKPTNKKTCV